MTDLYYEAHVTFEPVFDERLEFAREIVGAFGFGIVEQSEYETVCTTRALGLDDVRLRTSECVNALAAAGFDVWRYKIEVTLLDVRLKA